MMNDLIDFSCKPEDIFVNIPPALNWDYLVEIINRHLGEQNQILHVKTKNVCADMFGGVACSGVTVISMQVTLSTGKTLNLAAKVLSPDPVNLFKIDCHFDSRIAEIRWTDWWGRRGKPWSPNVYDTVLNPAQREFWILREFFPQIGWPDVPESEWGHFSLDADRLRLLVETVAEMHAESALNIIELQQLFPEPGIRQGGACFISDLEAALDDVIADEALFHMVGIGEQERDQIKIYRERVTRRPRWLDEWRIVCVTADLKPGNLAFRSSHGNQPVLFDFGSARLAPMEEEIALLLKRLDADEAQTEAVLTWYLSRFNEYSDDHIALEDFIQRLPWAEPFLFLRSLIEHADALRWVPWQDRSKGHIRYFIQTIGKLLDECGFF